MLTQAYLQGLFTEATHFGFTDGKADIWLASSEATDIDVAKSIVRGGMPVLMQAHVMNIIQQVDDIMPESVVRDVRMTGARIESTRALLDRAASEMDREEFATLRRQLVTMEQAYDATVSDLMDCIVAHICYGQSPS